MATPFFALKTLTEFDFKFTEVCPHFCELVLFTGKRAAISNMKWSGNKSSYSIAKNGLLIFISNRIDAF